jgi:hypothetical protein
MRPRPWRFPGNKTRNEAVFEKFTVPQAANGMYCNKSIFAGHSNFHSEETAVLSGNIRSLDFLATFLSSKK